MGSYAWLTFDAGGALTGVGISGPNFIGGAAGLQTGVKSWVFTFEFAYNHPTSSGSDQPGSGPGEFQVAAVPEQTSMLLLGSGLIGLAGYGRKKLFKKRIDIEL